MKYTGKIILEDAIKKVTADQDKVISPKQTLDRFKSRLTSTFSDLKILKDTKRIDNGRLGIPVFFSSCDIGARKVIGTKKQMGKGATSDQAEASAVMELAERYSFFSFYKNFQNIINSSYEKLSGNVMTFNQIAKSVNDESEDLSAVKKIFEKTPLNWTGAYNLTRGKEIIVPFNWFFTINAFNGPSAGNCVEEAICQGLCEIVERHVSCLISRSKISTPIVNTEFLTNSLVLEMLRKYSLANISLYITDFTLEMGIPSVGVLAYDSETFPETSEIVWTAGTAPNPEKALSRALTEVAQLAGDFNTCSNYVASGLPKFKTIEECSFITNVNKSISIVDLPDISNNNMKIELENCVDALNKLKMETIVINTTHPILQIPSFYTIVPGAHFRERAVNGNVAMFLAKIIYESFTSNEVMLRLKEMNKVLIGKYFIQFYIGKAYLDLKIYDKAISHLLKSLEMDPNRQDIPSIYSYLGVCFKEMGKYGDALIFLKKGESFDEDRTDIHNLKGFCYFMLKNYEKAIQSFRRVLNLDSSSAIDYANIGSCYREIGKKKEAIQFYKLALKIDSSIDFAAKGLEKLGVFDE